LQPINGFGREKWGCKEGVDLSFSCLHYRNEKCELLKKPCDPGTKGCVLYGRFVFSDPASPSNEALKRRERSDRSNEQPSLKSERFKTANDRSNESSHS
jgi:hypothetical protein